MALVVHIRGKRVGPAPTYEAMEAAREAIPPSDLDTAFPPRVIGVVCVNCGGFNDGVDPRWELDGRHCRHCELPMIELVLGEEAVPVG